MVLAKSLEPISKTPLFTVICPVPRESAPDKDTFPVPESVVSPVNAVLPAASVMSAELLMIREPTPDRAPIQEPPSPSTAVAPPEMLRVDSVVFAPVKVRVPPFAMTMLPAVPLMTPL